MPTRGYRKGISDGKRPRPHVLKSRTTAPTDRGLQAECDARNVTLSHLIDRVLAAHVSGGRITLPHPRGLSSAAIRELARLGNNLNQIAYQANVLRLHFLERKAAACLEAVLEAVDRLR